MHDMSIEMCIKSIRINPLSLKLGGGDLELKEHKNVAFVVGFHSNPLYRQELQGCLVMRVSALSFWRYVNELFGNGSVLCSYDTLKDPQAKDYGGSSRVCTVEYPWVTISLSR